MASSKIELRKESWFSAQSNDNNVDEVDDPNQHEGRLEGVANGVDDAYKSRHNAFKSVMGCDCDGILLGSIESIRVSRLSTLT
jgi:hypothetical protein